MSNSPFATSLLREGTQGFVGGSLVWVSTCTMAGVLATAAAAASVQDFDWGWAFAWIGHLAIAGLELWGLIIICIHAGCLASLVHGTERPGKIVLITFVSQLTTSTIVLLQLERETFYRLSILWAAFALFALSYGVRHFTRKARP